MDARTPADWVADQAEADFDRPALAFHDGVVTYGQLATEIRSRAGTFGSNVERGRVVPVMVNLDLPSIVDLFAHMQVGASPLPYSGRAPRPPEGEARASIVCLRTSGTSGDPRLVPLTMGNLSASVDASQDRLGTSAADRWLLCLPLTHIGGLSVLFRTFAAGGIALVNPFGHGLGEFMEATRPSVASLVPTMVHRLTASDPDVLAAVGTVLTGGAAMQPGLARRAHDLGITLLPTYGMTEASSQVATPHSGTVANHAGFVGPPLEGFDVRIASDDTAMPGRIEIDGPAVFDGYLGETKRTGSFETNDVGFFDTEGCLTVLGRVDDVVVSGGENVSLSLVESVLAGLDAIDQASVVAIPDAEWGTMVCALVVTTSDLSAIREAASIDLGPQEIPKSWARVDAVPLLENGKRDLNAIRAHFQHG